MSTKKPLSFEGVHQFLKTLFAQDLHAKRVLSLAGATLGVIESASLAVGMIGQGLALARGRLTKHAVKQVDRLLSNPGIDVDALLRHWVPYVVGSRSSITVAMDWTSFDADGQTTIMLSMLCGHGRATPLVWLTVETATLKARRNDYEYQVLVRLAEARPVRPQHRHPRDPAATQGGRRSEQARRDPHRARRRLHVRAEGCRPARLTRLEHTPLVPVNTQQLAAVLDGIPARIALLDCDRRHRYVNLEYAAFAGAAPEALLGKTVAEVIGAAAFEATQEFGTRALAGEAVHWEGWLPYTDGSNSRFVQRVYTPFRGETGAIEGYLVFVRDLTELKLGERRLSDQLAHLQMSQALNAAITASALDCIIVIDEAGCVIEFNPAAERTFGHARADVMGRSIGDIIVPPHLRARHAAGFSRYLKTGEAHVLGRRIEIEGLRASGEVFPLELAITEVRLAERRLFTAYLRDLTSIKAAAAELQSSRDALHQSEKMAAFGSLLAGVAHELNNPLSIVIGNAMLLNEDAADVARPLAERAAKIQTAAERCGRIVRTFLAMARQRPTAMQPFAIRPMVAEVVELLGYGLRTSNIMVRTDIPDRLPEVIGDPDQINQVVANLLVNAQQALMVQDPPRRIHITASVDGDQLMLAIADNGPGVPPDIQGRVFDPFFTTKPMGAGTGIGLAVSRGIIEAHDGTLLLMDAPGGGARFEIRLPLAAPAPSMHGPARGTVQDREADIPRSTALIVDDEPDVASVLAELIEPLGFQCETAAGGAEACERLAVRDYDAVLCDLHMPDMGGAALFAWLAAHKPHLCRRTAFITADTLGQSARDFLTQSGRPVLEKPFLPDELRLVLDGLRRAE